MAFCIEYTSIVSFFQCSNIYLSFTFLKIKFSKFNLLLLNCVKLWLTFTFNSFDLNENTKSYHFLNDLDIWKFITLPLKSFSFEQLTAPVAILKSLYSSLHISLFNYEPIANSPFLLRDTKE